MNPLAFDAAQAYQPAPETRHEPQKSSTDSALRDWLGERSSPERVFNTMDLHGFAPKPDGNCRLRQVVGNGTEMTPVKATILSLFMLSGIFMWGAGIYTAGAAGDMVAIDGYGVTRSDR